MIADRVLEEYEGMALRIMLRFDKKTSKFQLDLDYECLGLDLYGDTLLESYVYEFEGLENLLKYIGSKYHVGFPDIPVKYNFNHEQFPNPIKYDAKRPQFEIEWKKFQSDFKAGVFLDRSLKLIYSTVGK